MSRLKPKLATIVGSVAGCLHCSEFRPTRQAARKKHLVRRPGLDQSDEFGSVVLGYQAPSAYSYQPRGIYRAAPGTGIPAAGPRRVGPARRDAQAI